MRHETPKNQLGSTGSGISDETKQQSRQLYRKLGTEKLELGYHAKQAKFETEI